ncbi:MAG: hypothetical protein ACJ0BO_00530 [Candidatus Puniceispirillaceae bacterium]
MANFSKVSYRVISFLLITLCLYTSPTIATDEQTKMENAAFKEAVQAVKDKNYADAITLFEEQAKLPRHDAQYNLAILLNAGKGRPRNYVDALYWSWQAQLGNIEDAENLADDIVDLLPPKVADEVRSRVAKTLEARIEANDILAIPQFANFHLKILAEPDYGNAYIWHSIAAALSLPGSADARDDAESQLESKDLVTFQTKTQELFKKHNFKP